MDLPRKKNTLQDWLLWNREYINIHSASLWSKGAKSWPNICGEKLVIAAVNIWAVKKLGIKLAAIATEVKNQSLKRIFI